MLSLSFPAAESTTVAQRSTDQESLLEERQVEDGHQKATSDSARRRIGSLVFTGIARRRSRVCTPLSLLSERPSNEGKLSGFGVSRVVCQRTWHLIRILDRLETYLAHNSGSGEVKDDSHDLDRTSAGSSSRSSI